MLVGCEQASFLVRAGDLLPVLEVYVRVCHGRVLVFLEPSSEGDAFDFTGWTGLTFAMTGPADVTGSATPDIPTGKLTYTWLAGNTAVPGFYQGTFYGTSPTAKLQTFPTKGYVSIEIAAP